MRKSFHSFLLFALIAFCELSQAHAQQSNKQLSLSDSLLVKRYMDSVNVAPVYSQKRQRYLDSALMIKPWKASWWQQKAMPLYKQQKYEVGSRFLDSAVKYDAVKYIDYRGFMKCVFQKSYTDAIRDFELAKEIIGEGEVMDHTYDFYIGLSFLQLNMLDSAEYYLVATTERQRKTLGAKWVHPLDLFYLGIVYYEEERYDKALAVLDSCVSLYKNFSDAKFYKAMCLSRMGRKDDAKAMWVDAAHDYRAGYTINEDNAVYEAYPYQVRKWAYEGAE